MMEFIIETYDYIAISIGYVIDGLWLIFRGSLGLLLGAINLAILLGIPYGLYKWIREVGIVKVIRTIIGFPITVGSMFIFIVGGSHLGIDTTILIVLAVPAGYIGFKVGSLIMGVEDEPKKASSNE